MLSPMRIASSAVALEAVPATCAASAGTTATASAMPREDSAASTPRTSGVAMLSTVLLTRMLLGEGGRPTCGAGRALRPGGGVAGPWSHPRAGLPRICDRDTDHGPGPSGCRIMARMSASLLPSDAADDSPVVLHVRTRRIEEPVDLLAHVPETVTAAWL